MAEDVYIDEFDLTPDEEIVEKPKEDKKDLPEVIDVPGLDKPKEELTSMDILFGPKVEYQGDAFGLPLRRYAERVVGKVTGEELPELESDVSVAEGIVSGLIDASIKIPYGFVSLGAEVVDALKGDGVPVDKGLVARLENDFKNSFVGKITDANEDFLEKSAVGKLTSAFGQLYGWGKAGGKVLTPVLEKIGKIGRRYIQAAKAGKVITPNKKLLQAASAANKMNQASKKSKFIASTLGTAGGTAFVADVEDIGTLGDVFKSYDIPYLDATALDRIEQPEADDDAWRRLKNRFTFAGEGAAISIPLIFGINKVANKLATQGNELAYSNKKIDQWINKFGAQFRSRGEKTPTMFEGIQRVKGKVSVGQVVAKDLILDLDNTLAKIAKQSKLRLGGKEGKRLLGRLDELLVSTDDAVVDGKIVFQGFNNKKMKEFMNFADELGLNKAQVNELAGNMANVRETFNVLKNSILRGKNVNVGTAEFNKIMSERLRNMFTSEYAIFKDRTLVPFLRYKPTADQVEGTKKILNRYALEKGIKYTDDELDFIIEDILKNARFNPLTKTPEFFLTKSSVLDDVQTQLFNIADNIKDGKFQPTELIKTKADLRTFQRFFGQKRDIRNTIVNTMSDLATVEAKDEFYNMIAKESDQLIKEGKRAVVYPTRFEALKGLPNQKVITNKNGLSIKSPFGDDIYTNPINQRFTSETFKEALEFAEKNVFEELGRGVLWQHLVLIPKGAVQISKTILGPFTHSRNFFTATQFAAGTGNLFKNPKTLVQNFRQAFNTIQPQLLYRNTPKDQALYKFLLEENVVSSSATYKDIMGLLDDIGKSETGDFYLTMFDRLNKSMKAIPGGKYVSDVTGAIGKGLKQTYTTMADLYVAEDDIWKVFNFLGEFDTYKKAYQNAVNAGKLAKMPDDLFFMKKSASIVRDTVPNYSRVSELVKSSRRLPLGNFPSFASEVIRSGYNIIELGAKEAADPILKAVGQKRLVSFGATTAVAIPTISAMLKGLYGLTNDTIAAVREFVPDFSKDNPLMVYVGDDGKLRYIDASGGFVYDTFTAPVSTTVAELESQRVFGKEDTPLSVGVVNGMIKSFGKLLEPYLSESIWYQTVNDLFIRNGRTREGYQLWNPKAPVGEKMQKAFQYVWRQVGPGSTQQFGRLKDAIQNEPGPYGEKFDTSDELLGFFGFRGIKIDPKDRIGVKINAFQKDVRNDRGLLTRDTTRGGPVSGDDIIKRFIIANKARYQSFNKMQKVVKAAKILGMTEDELFTEFGDRGLKKTLGFIEEGTFQPFSIGKGTRKSIEEQQEKLDREFKTVDLPSGLDEATDDKLGRLLDKMYEIPLGKDFDDYIKIEDYVDEEKLTSQLPTQVPPLPEQPQPNPQVVQSMPQVMGLTQTGLTPTENALLSEAEKAMRLKQRGMG